MELGMGIPYVFMKVLYCNAVGRQTICPTTIVIHPNRARTCVYGFVPVRYSTRGRAMWISDDRSKNNLFL